MINEKPKLFNLEAKLKTGTDLSDIRMWSQDNPGSDLKIVFVNKKSDEKSMKSEILDEEKQNEAF